MSSDRGREHSDLVTRTATVRGKREHDRALVRMETSHNRPARPAECPHFAVRLRPSLVSCFGRLRFDASDTSALRSSGTVA